MLSFSRLDFHIRSNAENREHEGEKMRKTERKTDERERAELKDIGSRKSSLDETISTLTH